MRLPTTMLLLLQFQIYVFREKNERFVGCRSCQSLKKRCDFKSQRIGLGLDEVGCDPNATMLLKFIKR